ncbi:MAG TPA: hypothetical protein VGP47_00550 [Parachlamydiaceae bacterium]|nr:hypothetical protein [Parachlamydiaceae bacterium]
MLSLNISNSIGSAHSDNIHTILGSSSGLSTGIYESIRSIGNVAHDIFDRINKIIEPFQKLVVFKHLFQITCIPEKMFQIYKNCFVFSNKTDKEKKIDTGLDTLIKVREIGESFSTFVVALETIKAIPNVLAPITVPFSAILTVLSVASIITTIRSCGKTVEFMNSLDKAAESGKINGRVSLVSYEAMIRLIEEKQFENKNFISETFNTTEDKLADVLVRIQLTAKNKLSSSRSADVLEGQELVEDVVRSLKGRVKKNVILSSISITTSIVNIIGTALLLALPLLPIGWPLLALGIIVDVGKFIYHKTSEYQFAQAVGLKRTKWEWLSC